MFIPPGFTRARPLGPLILISNLARDVAYDVRLGSYSAVLPGGGPDGTQQIRRGSGQGSVMGTIYWETSAMF